MGQQTYDWHGEEEGKGQSPKVSAGRHLLKIVEVKTEGKNGPFQSRGGDPQILVIFANSDGDEAAQMITLSKKACWVLKRLIKHCRPPFDTERMTADGVTPDDFADQDFASKQLVGRKVEADVTWDEGTDGKDYPNIVPVAEESVDEHARPSRRGAAGAKPSSQPSGARRPSRAPANEDVGEEEIPF